MTEQLKQALEDPIWKSHKIGDQYEMDGEAGWKIAYYPIFDTYTGPYLNLAGDRKYEEYDYPRALVERPQVFDGVQGIDFREVPLHYLKRI